MHTHLLQHLLTNTARQYPDKEAVIFKGDNLTYSELEEKSNQLAAALSQSGVKTGDRVGIMLNKSIEAITSIFGILKTGAIYVPIDVRTPTIRAQYILKNCDIKHLISSSTIVKAIINNPGGDSPLRYVLLVDGKTDATSNDVSNISMLSFETALRRDQREITFQSHIADVSPAYILHTSGSTGVPKGVVISHLNALTFVNMAAEFFNIESKDRICSVAPLHFDLSVFDIFVAFRQGATLILTPEYLTTFPVKLAEYISNQRITVWNSVASLLSMLAEKGALEKYQFNALRIVHFSGDILPIKYLRILMSHMKSAEFYNIYGQTEANSSMYYQVNDVKDDNWKIPIGKPFPNFEIFALDENNTQIVPGQEGELYVKSSTVARGYWRNEKETNEKFIVDPRNSDTISRCYKTGDIVRIDEDGNFIFVGRKDHMIKSRGYRIELAEIEATLNSHSLIRQAVVIAVPDTLIGNRLIGHISLIDDGELSENDISIFCSRFLPKYMVPEIFIFHDRLPTISNGKIDRKMLERQS